MDNTSKVFIGLIVFSAIIFVSWFYLLPKITTNSYLEDMANMARREHIEDGTYLKKTDWWDNPILIKSFPNEDKTAYIYVAISAGKDGEYGTKDDLMKQRVDRNISKMLGRSAAKSAKEFFKGWKEGLLKKTKFD